MAESRDFLLKTLPNAKHIRYDTIKYDELVNDPSYLIQTCTDLITSWRKNSEKTTSDLKLKVNAPTNQI